jgi:SulP family sulfate permease
VGVVLAAVLFMKRMADVTQAGFIESEDADEDTEREGPFIPPDVIVYKISGPFFFGAAEKLKTTLSQTSKRPRALIVNLRYVPAVDATGLRALEEFFERTKREHTLFLIVGLQEQPRNVLAKDGLLERIGTDKLFPTLSTAIEYANRVKADKEQKESA